MGPLIGLVNFAFNVYWWLIFARVVISWIPTDPYHPLIKFIRKATDPVLVPLRNLLPTIGMIDISPMVALLVLKFIQGILVNTLWRWNL